MKKKYSLGLDYVINQRTNGANPFKIFEGLGDLSQDGLKWAIVKMPYATFLKSAYWFAVSSVAKSRAGMIAQYVKAGKLKYRRP